MTTRTKFKIMYPSDHHDPEKAGKMYKPGKDSMIVMNTGGVFFVTRYHGYGENSVIKLSEILPKYDVVWGD